ncbi:MAG: TIGR02147 family protein [Myxococcales bacterium]|nr:TIGR02147 family protein [Myxococcales bacterium]MCB9526360.1 TIGR02147 family protein [Myxococcales bacterium]
MRWQPDLYAYTDFRAYLRDVYDAAKAAGVRGYSFRALARRAGFSSPNFIKLVMDGTRNLGAGSVGRVARAVGVTDQEDVDYFEQLVAYGQAESADERYAAWDALSATARFRAARRIRGPLFAYLEHWYMPAVRELAASPDFSDDPAWVAARLLPSITVDEAAEALDFLKEHGLIVQTDEGWVRGEASLTTGHEPRDMAVARFHRQMIDRASESITRVPSAERNISGLTVCVSAETAERVRDEIHTFRERLLELCDRDDTPSRVHQINFQMFPLSSEEDV